MRGEDRGLCIATHCRSVDELVATLEDRCDETSIFVATVLERPIGSESKFTLLLADSTPALVGRCVVSDIWTEANNPFRRPGTRLGLHHLTPESQRVFERLQLARAVRRFEAEIEGVPPARPQLAGEGVATPRARTRSTVDERPPGPVRAARIPAPANVPRIRIPELPRARTRTTQPTIPPPTPRRPGDPAAAKVRPPAGVVVAPLDDAQTTPIPARVTAPRHVFAEGTITAHAASPLRELTDASLEDLIESALREQQAAVAVAPTSTAPDAPGAAPIIEHFVAHGGRPRVTRPAATAQIVPPPRRSLAGLVLGTVLLALVAGFVIVFAIATYAGI